MSITIAFHFLFLWHRSPSQHPSPFVSRYFLIPPSCAPCFSAPSRRARLLRVPPALTSSFTLLTLFTAIPPPCHSPLAVLPSASFCLSFFPSPCLFHLPAGLHTSPAFFFFTSTISSLPPYRPPASSHTFLFSLRRAALLRFFYIHPGNE